MANRPTNPYSTLTDPGAYQLWNDMQDDIEANPADARDIREYYQGEIRAITAGFENGYNYDPV